MVATGYFVERGFGVSFACWVLVLVLSQIYSLRSKNRKDNNISSTPHTSEITRCKKRIHYLCTLALCCILLGLLDPGTVFLLIPRVINLTLQVLAVSFLLAALLVLIYTNIQAYYCLLEIQGGSAISKLHLIVGWLLFTLFYWGGEFLSYLQQQRRLAALSKCLILILLILLLVMELYDYCEIRTFIREFRSITQARRSSETVVLPESNHETPSSRPTTISEAPENEEQTRCPIEISSKVQKFQAVCLVFTVASLILLITLLALDIVHAKDAPSYQDPSHYKPSYIFFACLFCSLGFLYWNWTPILKEDTKKKERKRHRRTPMHDQDDRVQLRNFFDIEASMKDQIHAICHNDNSFEDTSLYVDPDPLDSYVKKIIQIRSLATPESEKKARTLETDLHCFFNDKKTKRDRIAAGTRFEKSKSTISTVTEDELRCMSQEKTPSMTSQPEPHLGAAQSDFELPPQTHKVEESSADIALFTIVEK